MAHALKTADPVTTRKLGELPEYWTAPQFTNEVKMPQGSGDWWKIEEIEPFAG